MTKLIHLRRRLVFETPFFLGRRPLVVTVEAWGLRLREKGLRHPDLPISWAQIWNRAAIITADAKQAECGNRRRENRSMRGIIHER
jgi:hypothetical protein